MSDRLAVNLGIIYQDESLMKNPKSDGTIYAETLPDYVRVGVGASCNLTENTSSAVEQVTVNHLVAGSNPARARSFVCFRLIK